MEREVLKKGGLIRKDSMQITSGKKRKAGKTEDRRDTFRRIRNEENIEGMNVKRRMKSRKKRGSEYK